MKGMTLAAGALQIALTVMAGQAEMEILNGTLLDAEGNPITGYSVSMENQGDGR